MPTLGQQFKDAREAKGVSESEAGSATKILSKVIRAMEADDFSAMPAPTYAKGFIRLYAEYLGLEPEPLVEEYLKNHATGPRPLIDESSQLEQNSRSGPSLIGRTQELVGQLPRIALPEKLKSFFSKGWKTLPDGAWKDVRVIAGAVAGLVILIILISSISTCGGPAEEQAIPEPKVEEARLLLDEPLPDLYLVEPGKIESSR